MSEFWVSKKKYFCKYCDIYIADDAPSRQQHESGLRHKGNKDRFIRDLYKNGEKKKKEKAEEDREMKMIDMAAQAAYAKDVGQGHAGASKVASSSSAPAKPVPAPSKSYKSSDKWANYTTAAELGIVDVEGELAAAQAAIRQKEGRVGAWSTVAVSAPPPPLEEPVAGPSSGPTIKRPRSPTPDEEEDTRKFKVRQRAAPVGLGNDVYVPGEIRVKKREDGSAPPVAKKEEEADAAALLPQWRPTQWRRAGEPTADGESAEDAVQPTLAVKDEETETAAILSMPSETSPAEAPTSVKAEQEVDAKPAITVPASSEPSSLFKKRKMKSATAGGRKPLKA